MTDKDIRRHQQDQAERIIEVVRNSDEADDECETLEAVQRIIDEPLPLDERHMHEDSIGVSPDVTDPCGAFGSIEDLRWYMREYPDCFDDPNFFV